MEDMKRIAPFLAFPLIAASLPASADLSSEMVTAQVLPGWRLPDGSHMAGLHLTLADGWKTYWRAPGDAGIPPIFTWNGSRNVSAVQVSWPTPVVFDQNGMRSIGYKNEVVLPVRVMPQSVGDEMRISGKVEIGICSDICVPQTLRFRADLPATTKADPRIATALAEQPYSAKEAKVRAVSCDLRPSADGMGLTATINLPSTGGQEFTVIETGNPMVWVAEAVTTRSGTTLSATTRMEHIEGKPVLINRNDIRITVIGGSYAVDIQGCPAG